MLSKHKSIKVILGTLGSVYLCLVVGVVTVNTMVWIAMSGACANQVFHEIYSPDHLYKVVVFQRDCGTTTDFSTRVSILKVSDTLLNNAAGNIMKMHGHPYDTNVQVTWEANRLVSIEYNSKYRVFKEKKNYWHFFTGINIKFLPIIDLR